jgi:HNH endonuclease
MLCSKPYVPTSNSKGLYCSRSCAAKVNNHRRKRTDRLCAYCAGTLTYSQKKYCSKSCCAKHKSDTRYVDWLAGNDSGSDSNRLLSASIRKRLITNAGNKCSKCGWSEKNPVIQKVILTVDHIDGDWTNNRVDNLQVLCYNCHTLTETFGSLNRNGLFAKRPGSYRGIQGPLG